MEQRIHAFEKGHRAMKAMYGLGLYLAKSSIEQSLLNLIYFRVSQVNGCAYCLLHRSRARRTSLGGSRDKNYEWSCAGRNL